jgi:hypothetical protein
MSMWIRPGGSGDKEPSPLGQSARGAGPLRKRLDPGKSAGAGRSGRRAGDARTGRTALRLDEGHRREFLREFPEPPATRCGGGRRVSGYGFYIAPDDVKSRAALAVLEIRFSLQESDGKNIGPLLTLPLGG